ncbi:helix-turn-helix domain-containing protein [Actinoplanes bogorensis]|uniref:Helix-turn-helix domain-containing protein n=1 Tax=Paractinoplanes bogorensis TaxID=1610840 RepID=A0ABS5YHY6_9ACTN|nr:helix-turn-helix domain-containing protein [Actinoplanes bogorensis]MBU2662977.1 helix-turn-helix domain-containing protein [Actinoplanes bogorensis]
MTTSENVEDPRRAEARRLRIDPGLSRSQLMQRFGVGNGTLSEWLSGINPPEWTRRPNAKDDLKERAIELRLEGATVPAIALEVGVSKSTAYQWTKHLPLDQTPEQAAERERRRVARMDEVRWEPHRKERDAARAATGERLEAWVGDLTDRELILTGAVAYWCEGAKEKPWGKTSKGLQYINSDPGLILLFLRYVELLGVERGKLTYRLSIHETADIPAATRWWADVVGVPVEDFRRATLKKHNPSTVRLNVGDSYRGCLMVYVPKSSRLYWEVEAVMGGIVAGASRRRLG